MESGVDNAYFEKRVADLREVWQKREE